MIRLLATLAAALALWLPAHVAKGVALEARAGWPSADEYVVLPPAEIAPLLHAGYNELAADITWVRLLVYYGSARIGQSDLRYLERFIDNVLALDPRFKRPFLWAAYAVTFKGGKKVMKGGEEFVAPTQEEFQVSAYYLRRGIEAFPEDYDFYRALAMRLWWDLEPESEEERRLNREEAAALMERAVRLPTAPPDAATFAATLWSELGELEHARRTLREMLLTTNDERARAKMVAGFQNMIGEDREVELLERANRSFERQRAETLPLAPADLFVLLGPRPDPAFRLEELADDRAVSGVIELDLGSPMEEDDAGDEDRGNEADRDPDGGDEGGRDESGRDDAAGEGGD
jgi:hypothetical protein